MEKAKKPIYKKPWFYIVAILLAFILTVGIVYLTCYEIQKVIIKIVCDDKNPSTPTDYQQIISRTNKVSDLKYDAVYSDGYLDIISPVNNTATLPLVVYIHGGYYVGGDKLTKEAYCRVIADKGYIVANINYVLAPDEVYPAQLIQANTAVDFLIKNAAQYKIDTTKIFIGGDSAGGHLSGQLGSFYTNLDFASKINAKPAINANQLKGVLLLCGFYDFYTVRQTGFPLLNEAMWMLTGTRKYETAPTASMLNTIANVDAKYPNTYMTCGDKDPFYQQNIDMATKLKGLGVTVVDYLPKTTDKDLKHEFQNKFDLPECAVSLEKLFIFLTNCCK